MPQIYNMLSSETRLICVEAFASPYVVMLCIQAVSGNACRDLSLPGQTDSAGRSLVPQCDILYP